MQNFYLLFEYKNMYFIYSFSQYFVCFYEIISAINIK